MKVLIVHNRYREPGGEDECARSEASLLEQNGHEVVRFFAENSSVRAGPGTAVRSVWNSRTYAALRRIVRAERPDVTHFHNTFHVISPAGYWAVTREGVPVVQTLHNYRLLCPNGLLFRDGRACEDCVGKTIAWPAVIHRCYRDSAAASLTVTAVTSVHRLLRSWSERVDVYVAPSEFIRGKFVEAGFPEKKIVLKPHFLEPDPGKGLGAGGFALFVGRLSAEKGIRTLLQAWQNFDCDTMLRIVGDGPLAGRVAEATRPGRIEWLGRRGPAEVYELMGRARCVVVPSECYESFSRVVIEGFAKGTPVVVPGVGAAAGLVEDGVTGLHFRPGDPMDLARAVRQFARSDDAVLRMRERARRQFEAKYSGAANLPLMTSLYARAIEARSRRVSGRIAQPSAVRDLRDPSSEACRGSAR